MKLKLLLIPFLLFNTMAYGQAWTTTAVTSQTRTVSGSPQIRWIWGSSGIYSIQDSLSRFLRLTSPTPQSVISGTIIGTSNTDYGIRIVPQVNATCDNCRVPGIILGNSGSATGGHTNNAVFGVRINNGMESTGIASFDSLLKANTFQINYSIGSPVRNFFKFKDTSGFLMGYVDSKYHNFTWNGQEYLPNISPGSNGDSLLVKHGGRVAYIDPNYYTTLGGGISHVAGISQLQSYSSTATTLVVDTALRGGTFQYFASGYTIDNGMVFNAPGKGGGKWLRVTDGTTMLPGYYGALGDGLHDDAPAINAAYIGAFNFNMGTLALSNAKYKVNETILPKRNVHLVGPRRQSSNINALANTDNQAWLVAGIALTSDVILYDFQNDTTRSPYNSNIDGINIDMTADTSHTSAGLHLNAPAPLGGPFANGGINAGILISNVYIQKAKYYSFWNEKNTSGVQFFKCYGAWGQNHAWEIESQDTYLDYCAGFGCAGDGLYNKGNSCRITNCDFFSNTNNALLASSGNGITDEGNANTYTIAETNLNDRNGINIIDGTTVASAQRDIRIINSKSFNNSHLTDNTYSDINIGAHSGVGLSVTIADCMLSAGSSSSNKCQYSINATAKPLYLIIGNTTISSVGLSGTTYLSANAQQYAQINGLTRQGDYIGNTPITIADGTAIPVVTNGFVFITGNSSPTTITNFSAGKAGQRLQLIIGDANTSIKFNGHLHGGNGTAAMLAANGDKFDFYSTDGTEWYTSDVTAAPGNVVTAKGVTIPTFTSNGGPLYTTGAGVVSQVTAGATTTVWHGGTPGSFTQVLTADIAGANVTLPKLATQVDKTFVGNNSGLSASPTALSVTTVQSMLGLTGNITPTTVNGSSSGTAAFNQPEQDTYRKKVIIYCNVLNGTASYTFPVAFTNTPVVITTGGPASSVVTALTTTAMTITGVSTTGFVFVEGY